MLQWKGKQDALAASNGVLKSVSVYDARHLSDKSRVASPHASFENRSVRTRHERASADSVTARSNAHSRSTRGKSDHSTVLGLATPENESNRLQFGDSTVLRRRIHHHELKPRSQPDSPCPNLNYDGASDQVRDQQSKRMRVRTPVSERRRMPPRQRSGMLRDPDSFTEDDMDGGDGADADRDAASDATAVEGRSNSTPSDSASDSTLAQDMCLPSPSLSPVTAMNTKNGGSFFADQEVDTDSSFEATKLSSNADLGKSLTNNDGEPVSAPSLMDMPRVINYFESIPDQMKTYLMYQFLRRCSKSTLRVVADVVNPTLKCDFLAKLPPELALNIVKYLDVRSMCRAAQVSKKWRQIINSDERTWKEHFDREGFKLSAGELQRAIREGWGWQFPHGDEDFERDLSSSSITQVDPEANGSDSTFGDGQTEACLNSSSSRRPKRKAPSRPGSRRQAKRKITSASSNEPTGAPAWPNDSASVEGLYAAASAAAAAVPFPNVGLPSLRNLHLYKSLYRRHYAIRKNWMRTDVKPGHIAFRAHDRHVVTCLQFDDDKILTGSDDAKIHVYDTKTGAIRAVLSGHEGGVWALEYRGNTLVSGSTDRTVRVWDIERAKCTQIFHGHTSTVRCLQILMPTEVGKNSDGSPIMMPQEPLVITGSRDSNLRVWKLPKPTDPVYLHGTPQSEDHECPYFVRVLSGHTHSVRSIAAHADTLVSGSYDCTVRVWKISTGELVHLLEGHTFKVYSVVLDVERNRCISGSMDNLVKIWSLETGTLLYNLEGHTSLVGLLDLKGGRLVSAAADSTLRIWDPENGLCKNTLSAHAGAITCFQHDGHKVISGSDRTLKMWDVKTGECVRDLLRDLSGVWQVRFDERRCVAAVQRDGVTYIEVSRIHDPLVHWAVLTRLGSRLWCLPRRRPSQQARTPYRRRPKRQRGHRRPRR